MSGTLRFEILGPQRAWYVDREIDLGPGKQRAVLAVLLLSAGRPVSTGQIVEAVWPEDPPANGPNVVQKYVAGLRRVLEPDRSPRTPGQVLSLTDAGYLLRVGPEALDAVRFERWISRARQRRAEGRATEALTELAAALGLWQGEPFTGFTGPIFEAARQRLVELRAVALETRAELNLDLGRHRELVGELVELVAEFPVRERLRHQLMLALYRSGRQAEALAAYREFGDLLREEYGIEPGEALRELHRRMLRSDPTLAVRVAEPSTKPPRTDPAPDRAESAPPQPESAPPRPSPRRPDAESAPPRIEPPQPPPPALAPTPEPVPSVPPPSLLSIPVSAPPPVAAPRRTRTPPPLWASRTVTVLGTALVLLSFGCLTWLVILAYAFWRRSWRLAVASVGYLVLVSIEVNILDVESADEISDNLAVVFLGLALIPWLAGAVHVVLLSRGLWEAITGNPASAKGRADEERRLRREHARYLLYHYPAARAELRLGRPDLPRTFDDGGLVDVNAVPQQVLTTLPGLTPGQGQQIVMDRWLRGPYASMEELAARCLLPPTATEPLRDLLLFLPAAVPDGARPAGS
ncbi:BTAD domain-containing putative transcriptional regulator [Micromonospora tarensis]|uniref:Winged helix-turn-helix domain-containing protein n=1 Tax=Micromonospora tarensis TaxID=2806100 RepID=A0ABS1YJY9_9ACTN|nr:BTAD domain-containing putative transcriptional regulator [Micromonospora tarensis]MBM0277744.1 winged helix-turn-helix domain-containing protein [Micromonospora tarensis]